jgi:hypothetical protein
LEAGSIPARSNSSKGETVITVYEALVKLAKAAVMQGSIEGLQEIGMSSAAAAELRQHQDALTITSDVPQLEGKKQTKVKSATGG